MAGLAFFGVFLLIGPALVGFSLFGFLVPRRYKIEEAQEFAASVDEVWAVISDFAKYPQWLSYSAVMTKESESPEVWKQEGPIVPVTFEVVSAVSPVRLELRLRPSKILLKGERSFVIESLGAKASKLTMTQSGEVPDPLLRAYLFLFHRKPDPVKIFLRDLRVRVGA